MTASAFLAMVGKSSFIREPIRRALIASAEDLSDEERSDIARKLDELGEEFLSASNDLVLRIFGACRTVAMKCRADRERRARTKERLPPFDNQ